MLAAQDDKPILLLFGEDDLELVARLGKGRVCVTVGSALDIFGGKLPYAEVVAWSQEVSKGGGGGGAEPGAP